KNPIDRQSTVKQASNVTIVRLKLPIFHPPICIKILDFLFKVNNKVINGFLFVKKRLIGL
ncbi:MAG: hypothetical protein IJB13_05620, partial [Clostridia bacterium]|nr:hypothetical protein [Clostridia bacterium]